MQCPLVLDTEHFNIHDYDYTTTAIRAQYPSDKKNNKN